MGTTQGFWTFTLRYAAPMPMQTTCTLQNQVYWSHVGNHQVEIDIQ